MLDSDLAEVNATFKQMGMDYWLARTEKALERLQTLWQGIG